VLDPLGFYIETPSSTEFNVCLNLGMPTFSNRAQAVAAALEKAKELGLLK